MIKRVFYVLKIYHILSESKKYYDQGISSIEAAKIIDLKEYKEWKGANRVYMCIEKAYREFKEMPENVTDLFDIFYDTAKCRNIDILINIIEYYCFKHLHSSL
ncbi:hypothetical protein [Francisella philomiragia]|uniref:hypothetical protein n=1 Tax=Francisella philomiragia TaxID=28110 RepID=UPI0011EA615C|nr:hypothetical protein [Francisella philomiragia]